MIYLKHNHKMDIYSDYLISHAGHATATGLERILPDYLTHDKITHMLNNHEYTSKDLFRATKKTIRKVENDEGIINIDDTVSKKPYTDLNSKVQYYYSSTENKTVRGINILSAIVVYSHDNQEPINIPAAFRIVIKDEEYINDKGETKRRSTVSKHELAQEMIGETIIHCIKYKYICADTWYFFKDTVNYIHKNCRKLFIFGVESNRLVALSKEDHKNGEYVKLDSIFESSNERIVYVKGINFQIKVCKKEFTDENDTKVIYLATNDLSLSCDEMCNIYKKRWKIEEYHKSLKCNVALSKSPTKTEKSQSNHIFASILAFVKLEKLKINKGLNHFAIKMDFFTIANRAMYKMLQDLIGDDRITVSV